MPKRRFNPTLPFAFALAVALHAAVLPLVLIGGAGARMPWEADLSVVSLEAPDIAQGGDGLIVVAELRYQGLDLLDQHPTHRVWLSRDRVLDASDQQLSQDGIGRPVGQPYTYPHVEMGVTLPRDADGPYMLIFEADSGQYVHNDADRSNNIRARPIYIDGPLLPELAVTAANLPAQAIIGGTSLFDYSVNNRGLGWANFANEHHIRAQAVPYQLGWRDAVYLSTDTTLDERDLPLRAFHRRAPLAPGDTYSHTRVALDLPRVPPGTYHLILVADADQVLDQPSFTAGVYTQAIELVDTNLPDLAVASIAAPRTAVLGQPFTVQWEAANLGSVGTDAASEDAAAERYDAVYLSRDDTLDPTDTPLTTQRTDRPIAAQERQPQPAASVTIPNEPQHTPGDWHLIVVADDTDAIDEGPFEHNNAFAIPITLLAPQDETEPELGEPDNLPRLTVAWIEHERVEEHMARLTETVQPAIQNRVDPDPDAPLARDPLPPAPPALALQPGGAPRDPAQPVDPDHQQSARPQPPVPDAPETDTAPRPLDPNAQPPQVVPGLPGNADDLPMPREGDTDPSPNSPDHRPVRPDTADRDDNPRNPGDRTVDSEADPDAPDTDSDTDSQTPAERDSDTDETNPSDNDSDTASDVMDPSEGDQPNDNDPSDQPTERDGDADNDDQADPQTATPDPAEQDSDTPEGDPVPPSSPSEEQQTTRAPRDDAEADPTDNTPDRLRLEEGNVLVGRGVRVNTSRIRRGSTTSRLTAIPRDTNVRIVFDNQGRVVEAEVLGEGTGYEDWDARLLEALYRWTATGPDIEAADPHYVLQLEYQFGLLNRRE